MHRILLKLWRRRKLHQDLEAELAFHRDMALAQGNPIPLGNTTAIREQSLDLWSFIGIETAWHDLRYALRGLRRSLGFALTAILSLALGIGASLSIFTVSDNLLLRPLPYRAPSRLMMLWESHRTIADGEHNVVSPANYFDWRAQNDVFETMAAFREGPSVLTDGDRAEQLSKQLVSADLFPLLGVHPIRGRLFTAAEDRPASDTVLLISYRLWQSWFGGDDTVIGRRVQVNATPRTIIGVMPPGFYFRNREIDLWEPLGLNPAQNYRKTSGRYILSVARLKPGVTLQQAQARMTAIAQRLETAYPEFDKNWTVTVESLQDSLVREVKTSLIVLLCAVGLLLAVACANVANLSLARYTTRRQEMAVRASLGATRWRVVRQLLTESIVLSLAGGLLGILLAWWAVAGLLALAPKDLTRSANIAIDFRILLFATGLSLLTGIVFGLAPSLIASRTNLANALNDSSRSSTGSGRLRVWLVGAEVALSVMLLAGAGLLFRSLIGLQKVDPGLDASGVLTCRVSIPAARYPELPRRTQFFSQAIERIQQLPGVRSASAVSYLPFAGDAAGTTVNIAGRPTPKPGEELGSVIRVVMPGYFRTMGIPLKRGRDFTAADNSQSTPYRFMVNESFVRKFLPGEEPIGKSINAIMDTQNPYGEIVGVVGDVKEGSLDKDPEPTAYYIYSHFASPSMILTVRSDGNPMALAEPVRRIIRGLDSAQPVAEIRSMQEILGQTFARQRFSALLLSGFSIAALLLAAVGIYGVLAYSVSERTREIGVRVALGAEPGRIAALIISDGARPVLAGIAIGIGGALALSTLLSSLLFGIGPRDPFTFAVVPIVLMSVALVAAYVPARRAARLDPMQALRTQ
jgi:putative ABC transport system permease protein